MDWVIIIHIFIWWLEIIGYELDRPSTDYSFYENVIKRERND